VGSGIRTRERFDRSKSMVELKQWQKASRFWNEGF